MGKEAWSQCTPAPGRHSLLCVLHRQELFQSTTRLQGWEMCMSLRQGTETKEDSLLPPWPCLSRRQVQSLANSLRSVSWGSLRQSTSWKQAKCTDTRFSVSTYCCSRFCSAEIWPFILTHKPCPGVNEDSSHSDLMQTQEEARQKCSPLGRGSNTFPFLVWIVEKGWGDLLMVCVRVLIVLPIVTHVHRDVCTTALPEPISAKLERKIERYQLIMHQLKNS